jgi:hypothetical protein
MSLLSSTNKSEHGSKKMTIVNGEQKHIFQRLDESEMTPVMLAEYRRLQHELQCQEALLVLMQKLKTNQRIISQTNNNDIKQRTTTTTATPTTATKLSQQSTLTDGKTPLTATKQPLTNSNRSIPTKTPHPNQYTVNRSNTNSHISQQQSSKNSLSTSQATRQSNTTTNSTLPAAATRISSTVPTTATKTSSVTPNTSSSSKSNGVAAEQHLLNAKLALRKQLEQTLLQIPTPKPSTCDLTFIPGVNGWSEFLAYLGLEQALNTYTDIVNRRPPYEISMNLPYACAQCGTDWSVTGHEMSTNSDPNSDDKILCDRCTKTSQKKLLKQDHSNRLRQAFIKALQQEKELDAKFQQQSSSSSSTTTTTPTPPTTTSTVKPSSSSHHHHQQQHSKHPHQTNKHSNKPLSTKTSSNHHHHHHNNNSTNNNNHHSHSHSHSHHHHHSGKSSSSSSKSHTTNPSTISALTPSPAETLASTLAALQTNEQMELFQKHFLSNMLPFAVANQTAAALAAKSTQQQQQQAALAALPAMAASLMRQPNPAQYLLDMIPQAAKQQHHHHHHHSK